jgi:hypothetical protein
VLAYVFWHRPRDGVAAADYVASLEAFHERIGVPSWFTALERLPWTDDPGWYEDWYLVESWSGLGRLNEDAVSGTRRSPHDAAAQRAADGIAGIYALRAGRPAPPAWAAWLSKPRDLAYEAFEPELRAAAGDASSLWQRQMTLGPTPEFAVLGPSPALLPWPAVETGPR